MSHLTATKCYQIKVTYLEFLYLYFAWLILFHFLDKDSVECDILLEIIISKLNFITFYFVMPNGFNWK